MRNRFIAFAGVAVSLLAIPVMGDEGRIPIYTAPTVITAPGRYVLTGNLAIAAGSLITVTTSNVDIDLNGFVLSSTAAAPVISATGVNGLTIRNGILTGGRPNILIDTGTRIVIEDIHAVGATGGSGVFLDDCTQVVVRRTVVRGATSYGIQVSNSAAVPSAGGTLEGNLIEGCGGGIYVSTPCCATPGSSLAILNNRIKDISETGLFITQGAGCVVADNTLEGIGSYGMFLQTDRCTFRNNIVSRPAASGVAYGFQQNGSDNLILNNVVSKGQVGFIISGSRNVIEGNVANANSSFGFIIGGTGQVYRRNVARGNAGVLGACGGMFCSPDLCVSPAGAGTSAGDNFLPGPPAFPACV